MPSMPVEILPIAQEDVERALLYIAADDPMAADRLLTGILAALDQASRFPFSGSEISVGGKGKTRFYQRLYVQPYHIYYRIVEEKIIVMRVLHERMDAGRHLP